MVVINLNLFYQGFYVHGKHHFLEFSMLGSYMAHHKDKH